jgi:hypothetical protein
MQELNLEAIKGIISFFNMGVFLLFFIKWSRSSAIDILSKLGMLCLGIINGIWWFQQFGPGAMP